MKLLISGSRKCSMKMRATAEAAVLRAKEHGWEIIVGDAWGIDHAVIQACKKHSVPFHVYCVTGVPRCDEDVPFTMVWVPRDWKRNWFLYRDKVMVDNADYVYAIWNHESRGTKWTYDYAVRVGKKAWIT